MYRRYVCGIMVVHDGPICTGSGMEPYLLPPYISLHCSTDLLTYIWNLAFLAHFFMISSLLVAC